MSDALIDSLNKRISELDKRKADLEVALRIERKDHKALKLEADDLRARADTATVAVNKELADAVKARDEFKAMLEAAPSEKDARIKELETGLKTRDFRDQFATVTGKELAPGVSIEDLWHFAKFDPQAVDKLDDAQITELVGRVKEAKPILFQPAAPGNGVPPSGGSQREPKSPLKVDDSLSRGARDTTSVGRITYSKADMAEPGWMTKNKPLADAIANQTAVYVDN